MSTSTSTLPPASQRSVSPSRVDGRLVVHTSGADAGTLRLDLDVDDFHTAEEVVEHVQLIVPGELRPLSASGADGEDGRFVVDFHSSDIANAGQMPRDAIVTWKSDDQKFLRPTQIVSADRVTKPPRSKPAADSTDFGAASDSYLVGLFAAFALTVLLSLVAGFLLP